MRYIRESDARTMWCPMMRVSSDGNGGLVTNRADVVENSNDMHCIASDCMWWRDKVADSTDKDMSEYYESDFGRCGAIK